MKYYKVEKGKYHCLYCGFNTDSLMGMQSHVRKTKRILKGKSKDISLNMFAITK